MHEREFILAVQRFRDGAGLRGQDTQTVARKVRTVRRVDTDRGGSPPSGHKKSATPASDAMYTNWNLMS